MRLTHRSSLHLYQEKLDTFCYLLSLQQLDKSTSLLPSSFRYFYNVLTCDAFFDMFDMIFYFWIVMLDFLSLCNWNIISFHLGFSYSLVYLSPFHIHCFYGYLHYCIHRVFCLFVLLATAVLAFDHVMGLILTGLRSTNLKVLLLALQNPSHVICHLFWLDRIWYLIVCLVLILHSLLFLLI